MEMQVPRWRDRIQDLNPSYAAARADELCRYGMLWYGVVLRAG